MLTTKADNHPHGAPALEASFVSDVTTPTDALLCWSAGSNAVKNSPSQAPWYQSFVGQLQNLAKLNSNWDGEGSPAPSEAVLNSAAGFVEAIIHHLPTVTEPYLRPTPDGGLLLAWQAADREGVEIEFQKPEVVTFVYQKDNYFDGGIIFYDGKPSQDDDERLMRYLKKLP